jgi:hypothetical protein
MRKRRVRCLSLPVKIAPDVRNARGVFDSSCVQFRSKCPASVSFFRCKSQVFAPGTHPPAKSSAACTTARRRRPAGPDRGPASADGRVVAAIQECPAACTAGSKNDGRLICRL